MGIFAIIWFSLGFLSCVYAIMEDRPVVITVSTLIVMPIVLLSGPVVVLAWLADTHRDTVIWKSKNDSND